MTHPGRKAIEELVAGLEGVTPGPWLIESDYHGEEYEIYPQKDGPPPIGRWAEIFTVKDWHDDAEANAKHLSRCSPDNIRAIAAYVRQLEAERDELRRAVEWQPIETAPKDGTICWVGHECGFMEPANFNPAGIGFWVNSYTGLPISWRPRFWCHKPLPPAPSAISLPCKENGETVTPSQQTAGGD